MEVIPYSKLIGFDLHDLRRGLVMSFVALMDTMMDSNPSMDCATAYG